MRQILPISIEKAENLCNDRVNNTKGVLLWEYQMKK